MNSEDYQDGWRSYLQGLDDSENPFSLYTYEWHEWNDGWNESYVQHNRTG